VANLLPFTCLPGTIVASISGSFRRDHEDLPWIDIAYDGQAETGIDTRLQAFMHQTAEYSRAHGLDRER
jgi:predicted nucleic acid-binding protein